MQEREGRATHLQPTTDDGPVLVLPLRAATRSDGSCWGRANGRPALARSWVKAVRGSNRPCNTRSATSVSSHTSPPNRGDASLYPLSCEPDRSPQTGGLRYSQPPRHNAWIRCDDAAPPLATIG